MARRAKPPGARKRVSSGKGWYVVNAGKARWYANEKFGRVCIFERKSNSFKQLGINIHVLDPGAPNCMYHRESNQEDFLVLSGRCFLLVEEKKVPLKAWDFVHCPPGTDHVFVGAGRGPCAILMVGARLPKEKITYPVSALARRYGGSVSKRTPRPREAYADCPRWKPLRGRAPLPKLA